MKIYNSLTRNIEEFIPNEPGKVSMYTCGPTVYHFAHIGNLRTYICEDILEKILRFSGYDVKRVMNITDVGHLSSDADTGEDKMVKGAQREHKTVMEIAKFYTDAFFKDCEKLNIKMPDVVEPATNCISEFIHMIEVLLEKGFAYKAGENVYFDTSKLKEYYVFGNQNEDELMVGVRDDVSEEWESPWGVGYPGWHIECSCISMKHLGDKMDIHCGGVDNMFPHHTNEIAQSEAYLGHKWCNYWFHVHHLNDETGKMSKSKGEFLTVSLLESKGYDPIVYRMFALQSHYRKPLTFSYETLDQTAATYKKLKNRIAAVKAEGDVDEAAVKEWHDKFAEAVGNDCNTAMGLTLLYDVLKSDLNGSTKLKVIEDYDYVLSLNLLKAEEAEDGDDELSAYVEGKIAERAQAKKDKDFARADAIRDELAAQGIIIEDTREGVKWKRA